MVDGRFTEALVDGDVCSYSINASPPRAMWGTGLYSAPIAPPKNQPLPVLFACPAVGPSTLVEPHNSPTRDPK